MIFYRRDEKAGVLLSLVVKKKKKKDRYTQGKKKRSKYICSMLLFVLSQCVLSSVDDIHVSSR